MKPIPVRRAWRCEFEQARRQFAQHPIALRHLVARVQRRQLYRDAWRRGDVPVGGHLADRRDRMIIGREVARGIGRGARRLAEHVVGMPVAVALGFAGVLDRLLDGAADDELAAEDAHRGGHRLAHDRFAGAGGETAQRAAQVGLRRFGVQQPAGQHQSPGRGVDEDRFGPAEVAFPIRLADLVADQPVDRLRIRHPQQGFGETQERDPLGRGQRIFVQKRVDAAFPQAFAAHRGDERPRPVGDAVAYLRRDRSRGQNARNRLALVDPAACADCRTQRRRRWKSRRSDNLHAEDIGIAPAECSLSDLPPTTMRR